MSPSAPRHRLERPARRPRARLLVILLVVVLLVPTGASFAVPGSEPPKNPPGQGAQVPTPGPTEPETPVWAGYPGTTEAHDSYGYPWPAAPDCDESTVGTGGCVNDGLGFFQGQCTSWVAHRLGQRNGFTFTNWYDGVHWGDAADWAKAAKSLGIKPNQTPAVGSVGWYARGHVSYVEEVNADGSIVISEMNTDGHNGFHVVTVTPGGAGWPDKFIHIADVVPVDYTAPDAPPALTTASVEQGVTVNWERPADDLGVTGYNVLRNGRPLATTAVPTFVDRQASPSQAYTYSVEAYDAAGNVSDASTTVLRQSIPAPERLGHDFIPGSARLVSVDDRQLVCGRVGTIGNQRVGCRLRTPGGPVVVRTGREVPWGSAQSQVFLPGPDGRAWFCRSLDLRGGAKACLPFDLQSRSWGFDRIDVPRALLTDASWVVTRSGPARCGILADRATCSVLHESGWQAPRRAHDARPGDPLSRAFVPTQRRIAFCRVVEGRAACNELGGQGVWRGPVVRGNNVAHGRWLARPAGPALCPVGGGPCLTVARGRP